MTCMVNTLSSYAAIPDPVARKMIAIPPRNDAVRMAGHLRPLLAIILTPVRYSPAENNSKNSATTDSGLV